MLVLVEVDGHAEAQLDESFPHESVGGLDVGLDVLLEVHEIVQVLPVVAGALRIPADLCGHVADHVDVHYLLAGDDVPQQRQSLAGHDDVDDLLGDEGQHLQQQAAVHSGLQAHCGYREEGLQELLVEHARDVVMHSARPLLARCALRDPREDIHCQRVELLREPLHVVVLEVDLQQVHPELDLLPAGVLVPRHHRQPLSLLLLLPALALRFDLLGLRGVAVTALALNAEGLEIGLAVVLEDDYLAHREGLVDHVPLQVLVEQLVEVPQLRDSRADYPAEERAEGGKQQEEEGGREGVVLGLLERGQQILLDPLRHLLRELDVVVPVGVLLFDVVEVAGDPSGAVGGLDELGVGRAERAHLRVVEVLAASLLEVNFQQELGKQPAVRLEVAHDCLVLLAVLHVAADKLVDEEEMLPAEELHQLLGGPVAELLGELLQLLASLSQRGLTFTSVAMSYLLERTRYPEFW